MGDLHGLVHVAGVSPSQASPETILKVDLGGPRGAGYRRMIDGCPVKRAGTPDEVARVTALLMGAGGAFITGGDFLMDGGVTASYWFGELAPWSAGSVSVGSVITRRVHHLIRQILRLAERNVGANLSPHRPMNFLPENLFQ